MRIDITEKNMVWLVEHKMADTIVAEFHRKEAVIESLVQENARLKSDVERLRKAGDELSWAFSFAVSRHDGEPSGLVKAWNAAKEGKQS